MFSLIRYALPVLVLICLGCNKDKDADAQYWPEGTVEYCDKPNPLHIPSCKTSVLKAGNVFIEEDKKWLWGGNDPSWHFDISDWCLNECQLHYGLGRENFHALIQPEYESVLNATEHYNAADRFMIVEGDHSPKAYSIDLLTRHEIINDTIDGNPYMVGYCVLADLAAVYTRIYCDTTLTFGVSGYTYFDKQVWDGLDGFIIWDRETESLWWPLIDKAVSGQLKGTMLKKYNEAKWRETTWGKILSDHSNALVLKRNQTMPVPSNWPRYSLNCN